MAKRSTKKSIVSSNAAATSATPTPANTQTAASSESTAVDTRFATPDELTYANAQSPGTVAKARKPLATLSFDRYLSPGVQANLQSIAPTLSSFGLDVTQLFAAVTEGVEAYQASVHLENSAAAARARCSVLLTTVRAADTLLNSVSNLSTSGSPLESALAEISQSHQRRVTQRKSTATRHQNAKSAQSKSASAAPTAPVAPSKTGS